MKHIINTIARRRSPRWAILALLVPLATGALRERPAPRPSATVVASFPRLVADTEPPWVQIFPSGIVHASTVNLLITYCDDSTLNASSRTVTRDGSSWAIGYTTGTKRGCGAYASSSATFTLGLNASTTITAAISDNRGNRGSATATITYVPTYTVTVTADSSAVTRQSDANTSQTFTVRNSGSETGTYNLTPTCSGGVSACSAPTSVQVASGQSASVTVSYHTAIGPTTGTVSLQAVATQDNTATSTGSSTVTISALPTNLMVNGTLPGWTGLERSSCVAIAIVRDVAAQCDAFRILHPLPAVATRAKARAPTLVYFSDWVSGPGASVNVSIPTSISTIPDSVQFNVYRRNPDSTRTLLQSRSYGWAVDGFGRAAERLSISGVTALTGVLFYRLEVRFKSGTGAWQTNALTDGELLAAYRGGSSFGAGWWLAGVEQLALNQAGSTSRPDSVVAWIGGDGSMRKYVYRQTLSGQDVYTADLTPDRPDTLIKYPGAPSQPWTRHAGNNVRVLFDSYGRHILTINRAGDTTRMAWKTGGAARLDTLIVPAGLRYVFQYDANDWLNTIVAPGASASRQVQFARQVVNASPTAGIRKITDPSQDSVTFEYPSWAPSTAIVARSDRRLVRTQLDWEPWGPGLSDAVTPDGNGNNVVQYFRNPANVGMAPTSKPLALDSLTLRYTNPRGYATTFTLNSLGAPTQVVNTLGQTTTITYGNAQFPGLATQIVRPGGLTSQAFYNGRGLADSTTVVNPLGDGRNATTRYRWDPVWNMATGIHSPEGVADSITYDVATGNRLWQQDGRGSISRVNFGYDTQNRVIWIQPPGNASNRVQQIAYDPVLGDVSTVTTPLGFVSHLYVDAIGRDTLSDQPIDTLQTLRQKVRTTYNNADLVDSTISIGPAVPYTMHAFSSQYTWSAAVHPDTLFAKHTYDAEGNLTSVTSFAGPADTLGDIYVQDSYTYDNLGRKTYHSTLHGPWERFTYDLDGNVVSMSRPSGTLTSTYDVLDRVTMRVMPARSYARQRCDGFPYGPETGDSTGNGCFEVYPAFPNDSSGTGYLMLADTARFTYDASTGYMLAADNRYAKVHRLYYPNGAIQRDSLYILDGPRMLLGGNVWVGTAYPGANYASTAQYNLDGKRTSLTALQSGGSQPLTYAYRGDNGALQSITDPTGNWIRYTYDAASRIDSLVVGPAGGGNSIWETHVYDADGRQTRRIRSTSSRGVFDESFWYDAQGRPLKVGRSTAANGAPTDTSNLVYSGLGAVQARERIDQLGQWESEEFRNDAFGNVIQSRAGQSNNGGVQDPRYEQYLFRGQLSARNTLQPQRESETFSQVYDADGNVSQRFLLTKLVFGDYTADDQVRNYYDAANRLRAVQHYNTVNSNGVERGTFDEYEYDALGRRIVVLAHRNASVPGCVGITYCITNLCNTTSCASSQTRFAWDGQALLTEDRLGLDGGGLSSDNGIVTYVNGLELDRPLGVLDSRVSGGLRVPHPNWRGMFESSSTANGAAADCSLTSSPCTAVAWNATGAIYQRPAPTDVSYNITYTWVGGALMDQQDATGLLYRRNRYYDPMSGRFTQEDPIGLAGGLNAYGFAAGDPVNFSDPLGLCVPRWWCELKDNANAGYHAYMRYMRLESGPPIIGEGRAFALGQLTAGLTLTMPTAKMPSGAALGAAAEGVGLAAVGATDSQILARAEQIYSLGEGADVLGANQRLWAALDQAAGEVVKGGRATEIGSLGGQPVIGSSLSGVGVVRINDVATVVRRVSGSAWEVIRRF